MKKILFIAFMVIILGVLCTAPVSAEGDRNECEEKYNISYYPYMSNESLLWYPLEGKVESMDELTQVFPNKQEILSKYDEEFFEDKFIYVAESSHDIKIDSIEEKGNNIIIRLSVPYNTEEKETSALIEFDKAWADKHVSMKGSLSSFGDSAKISYYKGVELSDAYSTWWWDRWEDPVLPSQRRKIISSSEELTRFTESVTYLPTYDEEYREVLATYDDAFFEDKFLLFVNWKYGDGSEIYLGISDVDDEGGQISIEAFEAYVPAYDYTIAMECDWLVVFEMDASLLEEGFSLTMNTRNRVELITYLPPEAEPRTAEVVLDNAFGQSDTALVELSLGEDNGNKGVMVGFDELYYSVERGVYVGVVSTDNVSGNALSNVSILDKAPNTFTYGDLDGRDINVDYPIPYITNGDLYNFKLYLQDSRELGATGLLAADVNGDGQINNGDLFQLKLFLSKERPFSVLNK